MAISQFLWAWRWIINKLSCLENPLKLHVDKRRKDEREYVKYKEVNALRVQRYALIVKQNTNAVLAILMCV